MHASNAARAHAPCRCRNIEPPLDLSAYEGLELRVKVRLVGTTGLWQGRGGEGARLARPRRATAPATADACASAITAPPATQGNGLRYKLIIRTEAGWDTVGYTAGFDTTQGAHGRRAPLRHAARGSSLGAAPRAGLRDVNLHRRVRSP